MSLYGIQITLLVFGCFVLVLLLGLVGVAASNVHRTRKRMRSDTHGMERLVGSEAGRLT